MYAKLKRPNKAGLVALILTAMLGLSLACAGGYMLYRIAARAYTINTLNWARSQGVYATPQQGVIAMQNKTLCGIEKIEIEQAATNSFDGSDPHVWFVLYTVYAKNRVPCDADHPGPALYHKTYERGGVFFLNVKDGWVWMPEEKFPVFIGHWMKQLDLAGPGDPTHVPRN